MHCRKMMDRMALVRRPRPAPQIRKRKPLTRPLKSGVRDQQHLRMPVMVMERRVVRAAAWSYLNMLADWVGCRRIIMVICERGS